MTLAAELETQQAIIGLRNKIVHNYMNIDLVAVEALVGDKHYQRVVAFLLEPVS